METNLPTEQKTEKSKGFSGKQVAGILIIIVLLAAGIWTGIRISPYLPNAVNSLTAAVINFAQTFIPGERLIVYSDSDKVESKGEISLNWLHRNRKSPEGTYSLSFPCVENLDVNMKIDGKDEQLVCDVFYEVSEDETSLTLVAVNKSDTDLEFPIWISFDPGQDASVLRSSRLITVLADSENDEVLTSASSTTSTRNNEKDIVEGQTPVASVPAETPKEPVAGKKTERLYTMGTVTPKVFGKADLYPRLIEIGVLDKVTNAFTATSTFASSDRVAVRFEIENIGTADSGSWHFSAVLPSFPLYIFQSESQQNLGPGDRIEYTLGFDSFDSKNGKLVINVDPNNQVSEASESNNLATTTLSSI